MLMTFQGTSMSISSSSNSGDSDFTTGLAILIAAQILSAYMGAYTEDTYATHGSHWRESLFYSHVLSLPLFLPLAPRLRAQYAALAQTAPLRPGELDKSHLLPSVILDSKATKAIINALPSGLVFLGLNIATQLVCITGVNILCASAGAVTVTIVLNIRKLVSFILSTVLFGHELSGLMIGGAVLVFAGGGIYGWESSEFGPFMFLSVPIPVFAERVRREPWN